MQLVATEAPYLTAITRRQTTIYLSGSSNSPASIPATTNFLNWTNLGSLRLTNGSGVFSDATAGDFSARFYQATWAIP